MKKPKLIKKNEWEIQTYYFMFYLIVKDEQSTIWYLYDEKLHPRSIPQPIHNLKNKFVNRKKT